MKIENIKNINIFNNFKIKSKNCAYNSLMPSFTTNSLNILGNYNKAICFKGKEKKEEFPEIKELSDEEFEEYKAKVVKKLDSLPFILFASKIKQITKENIFVVDRMASNEIFWNNLNFTQEYAFTETLSVNSIEKAKIKCALIDKIFQNEKLCNNPDFCYYLGFILSTCNDKETKDSRIAVLDIVSSDEKLLNCENLQDYLGNILCNINYKKDSDKIVKILKRILDDKHLSNQYVLHCNLGKLLRLSLDKMGEEFVDMILSDKIFYDNPQFMDSIDEIEERISTSCCYDEENNNIPLNLMAFAKEHKDFRGSDAYFHFFDILVNTLTKEQLTFAKKVLQTKALYNNKNFIDNIGNILFSIEEDKTVLEIKLRLLDKILNDNKLAENYCIEENLGELIHFVDSPKEEKITSKVLSDERFYNNEDFMKYCVISSIAEMEDIDTALKILDDPELLPSQIAFYYSYENDDVDAEDSIKLKFEDIKRLNRTIGLDNASGLDFENTRIACKFCDIYGLSNVNQIPVSLRREILKKIINANSSLFDISDATKTMFPLLPANQEEYCEIVPKLTQLINVEPALLSKDEIKDFYITLNKLSDTLAKLSDEEFKNLKIKQSYSKDDFIRDILKELSELLKEDKQEIFNYFNFEIKPNDRSLSGFSIEGYPSSPKDKPYPKAAKEAKNIEKYIEKFNKDNKISSNNPEIAQYLNKILNIFPELRLLIGKVQSGNIVEGRKIGTGSHDYDVFKHSLKVMQKISQDPKFNRHSDGNILLLASLFHDITKAEGHVTRSHPETGAFDTYFITKKLGLRPKSEYKLYTLIKNHEWLSYANSFKHQAVDLDNILDDIAYELRYDDMLDLALIFTHADLRAVRQDDSFHDKLEGSSRRVINGRKRSFGESADLYARNIEDLIKKLKKTQPILPVTKFPSASRINQEITEVHDDGSTNIKGVYKDKDGLIVINYNEVEDWETIGFSKGAISKGLKFKTPAGANANTGNIKFFAHGLDYPDQLANFDAFSLIDSDALLSVSYAERPEAKFRFFRPQGVILDVDTRNIHGGGNTDSGSGYKKTVEDFKRDYIFYGCRKQERAYVSELIKKNILFYNSNYADFVKNNENKEPQQIGRMSNNLIETLASINSNTRKGERNYNEFYISNPKIMAVYAYSYRTKEHIKNPIKFLNRKREFNNGHRNISKEIAKISTRARTKFLRQYALSHDVPFVVFGE